MTAVDFAAFAQAYEAGIGQIVMDRIVSDLETPVSAFLKLCAGLPNAFLLESVEGGEQLGRYSIIGCRPDVVWRCFGERAEINAAPEATPDAFVADDAPPLASLKRLLDASRLSLPADAPPMAAGVFGYLGYDLVRQMERLPDRPRRAVDIPDAIFLRPTVVAVFDNIRQEISIIVPARKVPGLSAREAFDLANHRLGEATGVIAAPSPAAGDAARRTARPAPLSAAIEPASNTDKQNFLDMVARAKDEIAAGEIFQVVLSQRFDAPFAAPPFELYRSLRRMNPSPFLFYLDFGGHALVGSSPEILVRVRAGEVTIRPIAGTRPRGADAERDRQLSEELLNDPKERAEHLMLLDLGRNDVGRAAAFGTVRVTEAFTVERYSHVMHIVSNVVGRLRDDVDPVDAIMAGFPAGTVTGAPKVRAMEIIDALEADGRHAYAGAIGYFAADGDVDTCIALRTAVVKDGMMHVQAGAGIVADSDPETEHQECVNKAKALFAAAADAHARQGR